jgi:hypothetical protein
MQGHIQLGTLTDTTLRDYALVDIERYQAATANPFVARISTGGNYNELDLFNDWTTQDWHQGVGHVNPEEGQAFSHAMTLYSNYLLPPLGLTAPLTDYSCITTVNDLDDETDDIIPYSTHWYSSSFTPAENMTLGWIGVYMFCPTGNTVSIRLYSNTADKPNTLLASSLNNTSTMSGVYAHWFMCDFSSTVSLTGGTIYHIAVQTNVASMPASGVPPHIPPVWLATEVSNVSTNGGSSWTAITPESKGFLTLVTAASTDTIKGIFTNSNGIYIWNANSVDILNAGAYTNILRPPAIYDVKLYGKDLYIAYGTGYYRYDTDTTTNTDFTSVPAYMLLAHGGYLWRSLNTSLAYSNDETTWITIPAWSTDPNDTITGMAGLGEDVYFTTPSGLWMVALGDQILQVLSWGDAYTTNGVGMVSWENALYVPMGNGTIFRYDASGGFLNISPNVKLEFPEEMRRSTVAKLYPSNFFLLASYSAVVGEYPSLWAYNVDGWHCLAVGPRDHNDGVGGICIDTANEHLYWGLSKGLLLRTMWPGSIVNPTFNTELYSWARDGWVEYDKFYAGHRRLEKNFPGLLLDGDQHVEDCQVYWKDSTHSVWQDGSTWGDLGVVRPIGEWIKIGVRLISKPGDAVTPAILRAITLKYSTNVADRWRWTLPLAIHDNQEMPDGSLNQYTMEQMRTHLESMIESTEDIQFVDLDGTTHIVKVAGASRQVDRYEYQTGTDTLAIQWVYTISLEEVS